jgi:PhnB protein
MARVSTYLNFMGNTEEAFEFYRSVFGGEFTTLDRMGAIPGMPLTEEDQTKVMHVALPILGGHTLMGTDMLESLGHRLEVGNNVSIAIEPDSLEQGQDLHRALSVGATDIQELSPAPWGGHYGSVVDQFGVRWMFNVPD